MDWSKLSTILGVLAVAGGLGMSWQAMASDVENNRETATKAQRVNRKQNQRLDKVIDALERLAEQSEPPASVVPRGWPDLSSQPSENHDGEMIP